MNTNQNANGKSEMPTKKNLIISGAVILVVLAALIIAPRVTKESTDNVVEESTAEQTASEAPKALSRSEATVKYAGSILSFETTEEKACGANPEVLTSTAGTTIMLDNKTAARRTILIGSKSYSVGSERYTLSSMNMGLGEHTVSCDGAVIGKIVIK